MQFSLFGAEAAVPVLADLDGVLLAGGHWLSGPVSSPVTGPVTGSGPAGARLSVVVADPWRVAALTDAFTVLGVADTGPPAAAAGDVLVARTALTPVLRPLEARWRHGATESPPPDLLLSAAGLRLWAVAAGRADDAGYVLGTTGEGLRHRMAGALLARTGVAAVELGQRGGPGWRVTSVRRLRRLAELVGAPPPGAGRDWPALEPAPGRWPARG